MSKADVTIDKSDLKRPDVFVQTMEKSWMTIEKNGAVVAVLISALIVAALGYLVWDFVQGRAEKAAAEDLYKAEAEYFKIKDGFDRARFEALVPASKDEKSGEADKPQAATGDLEQDYGKVISGLEEVVARQAKTAAGTQAAVWLAEIYLDYKQPEKAVAALDKVVTHQSESTLLFGVANMVRGSALAAKGDCAQAVDSWQKVVDSPKNSFLHPEALLKSGVCQETLQQHAKAIETYRRLTETHSETSAGQMAKAFLRALEMKTAVAPAAKAG